MIDDTTQQLQIVERLEDLFSHSGWKDVQDLVKMQLSASRANLEIAPNPDVHVYQGEIRAYKYLQNLQTLVTNWRENADDLD